MLDKAKCMPVVLDVVVDTAVLNIAVPHDGLDIVSVLSQLQLSAYSITDPMVQNGFEGTILMINNDNTNNDSIRVAVEAWNDLNADQSIMLEDISNEVDEEVNEDIMVDIVSMDVNNYVVATVVAYYCCCCCCCCYCN